MTADVVRLTGDESPTLRRSNVVVPPKLANLPSRVTGTFLSLARSLSCGRHKVTKPSHHVAKPGAQSQCLQGVRAPAVVMGTGITICLCGFESALLLWLVFSMSSAVSPPTEDWS